MIFRKVFGPLTVREWIQKYNRGKFHKAKFKTWVNAGWVEWFCSEELLTPKITTFAEIISGFKYNEEVLDHYTVSFGNHQQDKYAPYDVICFTPFPKYEKQFTYFTIECFNKQNKYNYVIFTERNDYREEIYADALIDLLKALYSFSPCMETKE